MESLETYICPICNKRINRANELIHQATCERNYQKQQANIFSQNLHQHNTQNNPSNSLFINNNPYENQLHKLVDCPQCGKKVLEIELNTHLASTCEGCLIPCEFCNKGVNLNNYQEHLESCPKNPDNPELYQLPCEFCGQSFNAKIFKDHITACSTSHQNSTQNNHPVDHHNHYHHHQHHHHNHPINEFYQDEEEESDDDYHIENPRSMAHNRNNTRHRYNSHSPPSRSQHLPQLNPDSEDDEEDFRTQPNVLQVINLLRAFSGPDGSHSLRNGSYRSRPEGLNPVDLIGAILSLTRGTGEIQISANQGVGQSTLQEFPVVKFDSEKHKNLDEADKKCPICLEEFQDGEEMKFLPCMMRFHSPCIDSWLVKNRTCPVCKKDVTIVE